MTEPLGDRYGRYERDDNGLAVRFTRHLEHRCEAVWAALTEPDHLAAWFPTTIEGERRAGAPLRFSFREIAIDPFDGELLRWEPPSVFELRWGGDTLRFELRPYADGCTLELLVHFEEIGKGARDGAGWHACLELLQYDVDGQVAPATSDELWRQVRGAYIERAGPEASTLGVPEEWEDTYGPAESSG